MVQQHYCSKLYPLSATYPGQGHFHNRTSRVAQTTVSSATSSSLRGGRPCQMPKPPRMTPLNVGAATAWHQGLLLSPTDDVRGTTGRLAKIRFMFSSPPRGRPRGFAGVQFAVTTEKCLWDGWKDFPELRNYYGLLQRVKSHTSPSAEKPQYFSLCHSYPKCFFAA